MTSHHSAILTVQSNAARQLERLDRSVRGTFVDFQTKFVQNKDQQALRLKPLKGHKGLWSARIGRDYRALLIRLGDNHFMLIAVMHRKDVYDRLDDRLSYQINAVTGGIEVIDPAEVAQALGGRKAPAEPQPAVSENAPGLFDAFQHHELTDLGVSDSLLPSIMSVTTSEQLDELLTALPEHTAEVLLQLATGASLDEVMEFVTAPVKATGPVDTEDFASAANQPATIVTSSDAAVTAMLEDGFDKWRLFLHPTQRRLMTRDYNGPARVSGGPGTGKTVVALHRVARLAGQLPLDSSGKILLTTFTKSLAGDLADKLRLLAGPEVAERVEVTNIDTLSRSIAYEGVDPGRRIVRKPREVRRLWEETVAETGETEFDPEFLDEEFKHVVCGQLISSRTDYFMARRSGRGRRVSRAQRARIWQLVEHFKELMDVRNQWTWDQIQVAAALAEENRSQTGRFRYAHIVVDEAQDLTAAHWRLLRASVASGRNDMFVAGDTYQRIYGKPLALGPLGIDIRGRSSRLSLSYRTTRQILRAALGVMKDVTVDDLDDGTEALSGYRSILSGSAPTLLPRASAAAELSAVVEHVNGWIEDTDLDSIAVCAPTNDEVELLLDALKTAGTPAGKIDGGPPGGEVVHVGTMHQLKGLEYRRVLVAGVGAASFPRGFVKAKAGQDAVAYQHALQAERSLLFVATTRARDELALAWHGQPSPLLAPLL